MRGKQSALTSALSKGHSTQVNGQPGAPNGSAAAALACKHVNSCPQESFPCLYVHEHGRVPLDAEQFDDEERVVSNDPAARFLSPAADEVGCSLGHLSDTGLLPYHPHTLLLSRLAEDLII